MTATKVRGILKDGNTYFISKQITIDGKRHFLKERGFSSLAEARARLDEWTYQIKHPLEYRQDQVKQMKFKDVFDEYVQHAKLKIKPTTIDLTIKHYKYYIAYFWGDKFLSDITTNDCEKFKNILVESGIKEKTINRRLIVLRNIFNYAYSKNYINSKEYVEALSNVKLFELKEERQVLSEDEIEKFFSSFLIGNEKENYYFHFFKILYHSTMRPNEFLALQVKDIKGQYLIVNKTLSNAMAGGGRVLIPPKTNNSNRKVLMPQSDIDYLLELTKDYKSDDFIWGKDKPLSYQLLVKQLNAHIEMAQVPKIVMYGFRHSSITNMLSNGVPIKVVSTRAGHSDVSTTLDNYLHLLNTDEDKTIQYFDKEKGHPRK